MSCWCDLHKLTSRHSNAGRSPLETKAEDGTPLQRSGRHRICQPALVKGKPGQTRNKGGTGRLVCPTPPLNQPQSMGYKNSTNILLNGAVQQNPSKLWINWFRIPWNRKGYIPELFFFFSCFAFRFSLIVIVGFFFCSFFPLSFFPASPISISPGKLFFYSTVLSIA